MKMKITSYILSLFFTVAAYAQPTLQSSYLQTGYTYDVYMVTNPNPAQLIPGGANATWNLSSASTVKVGSISIVAASETPYASTYPTANVALKFQVGSSTSYSMFNLSSTSFDMLADKLGSPDPTTYSLSREIIKFPLSFNDTYSDDYQKTGQVVKTSFNKYDAYGTLQTPDTTYNNVVRIMQVNGDGDTSAIWWTVNNGIMEPLMDAGDDVLIWKRASSPSTGVVEQSLTAQTISVYPNPVKSELNTNLPTQQSFTINIFDVTGKCVHTAAGFGGESISLDYLQNGMYYYTIQTEDATYNGKFLKE